MLDNLEVTTARGFGMSLAIRMRTPDPTFMKTLLNLCCAASFLWVVSIAAGNLNLPLPSSAVAKTPREVSPLAPSAATVFGSHVRSKVVQYFDTYRNEPLGLPPGHAAAGHLGEIPVSWNARGLSRGGVLHEHERHGLVETSADIQRILPARQPEVRYYLAGRYLVAVDSDYRIVDFIRIPTVRLSESTP